MSSQTQGNSFSQDINEQILCSSVSLSKVNILLKVFPSNYHFKFT